MDPEYIIPAVRAETPPVIDGVLDDSVWRDAPKLTGFTDVDLHRPAVNQTIVRILYDDEHIYFGFEMLAENPSRILATERRRDRGRLRSEDYIQVSLDTFHDRRRSYMFLVSPLGTQWDARDGVFGRHVSWDANWQSAAVFGEHGWTAEVAIPIREMQFHRGENVTWGLNFRRRVMDGDETSMWRYNPEQGAPRGGSGPQATADFGMLTGLDLTGVQIQRISGAEVYGSVESISERGGASDTWFHSGGDLEVRLGPQWVSNITINPDFGQVEADPDTIQLRDTERFLEERRPFFSEGVELFQTPINVYHSRRITDIDAGAKVTGAGRNWGVGLINLKGESFRPGRRSEGLYQIGRATWNIDEGSEAGAIWTVVDRDDGYNLVGGLDHRIRLTDTIQLKSQYLTSRDKERETVVNADGFEQEDTHRLNGHAFYTELTNDTRPFTWEINYTDIARDFLPELGFIPRRDIRGPHVQGTYRRDFPDGPLRSYSIGGSFTHYRNRDGDTTLRDWSGQAGIRTRNHHTIFLRYDRDFHAPFRNRLYQLYLGLNQDDYYRSWGFTLSKGIFQETPYYRARISKPFRLGERFTTVLSYDHRVEERVTDDTLFFQKYHESIWLARSVSEYTFPWEGRVRLTLEQSSEDRFNRTLLFAYEDVKTWDYFLVLTHSKVRGRESVGAFSKFVYRF